MRKLKHLYELEIYIISLINIDFFLLKCMGKL